jgi:transglutaminase-like putative cysteine protease
MISPQSSGEAGFRVFHRTQYVYSEPVPASVHHAVLEMRNTPRQRVSSSRMIIEPEPRTVVTGPDYFGNNLTRFTIETAGNHLRVDAESEVFVSQAPPPDIRDPLTLEDLGRRIHSPGNGDDRAPLEFVFDSPYILRSSRLSEYGGRSFRQGGAFMSGVASLMNRIHGEFRYDPTVTETSTPVEEVLRRKEGVCQDFAHFMIGCLRSIDVPARYVSGYLVPLPSVIGAQASHAWVSVYSSRLGWVDFDPTNGVLPSGGHITVGWGRDFGDVSPIRGVVLGGGEHSVDVEVRVRSWPGPDSGTSPVIEA